MFIGILYILRERGNLFFFELSEFFNGIRWGLLVEVLEIRMFVSFAFNVVWFVVIYLIILGFNFFIKIIIIFFDL